MGNIEREKSAFFESLPEADKKAYGDLVEFFKKLGGERGEKSIKDYLDYKGWEVIDPQNPSVSFKWMKKGAEYITSESYNEAQRRGPPYLSPSEIVVGALLNDEEIKNAPPQTQRKRLAEALRGAALAFLVHSEGKNISCPMTLFIAAETMANADLDPTYVRDLGQRVKELPPIKLAWVGERRFGNPDRRGAEIFAGICEFILAHADERVAERARFFQFSHLYYAAEQHKIPISEYSKRE